MSSRRFGRDSSFNFSFSPDADSVPLEDPPPPYMHAPSRQTAPSPGCPEGPNTATHEFSAICFCETCTEIESRNWQKVKSIYTGPWTVRKALRVAKILFVGLFIAVFALRMLSHFHPIALLKTLGYDIYSAAGDAFYILFVYPVAMTRHLPSWIYHQTAALWADLRAAQSFVPTFVRLVARFIGIFIFFFYVAPYLIRNLLLRPLRHSRNTKPPHIRVNARWEMETPDQVLARMMREARVAFPDVPPSSAANGAGGNGRRSRRRR